MTPIPMSRNFRAPLLCLLLLNSLLPLAMGGGVFRDYIGALFTGVKFSEVPIDPRNEFHFLLSFAIDYNADSSPTDGIFNIFWDSGNLSPSAVSDIKSQYPNVKVALSIGGDSVGGSLATFHPSSVDSWVRNAVDSLTTIIQEYRLDGIDIDYEHFEKDAGTFAQCIGQLITTLKSNGVISFASIAPFDDDDVQNHYQELWRQYGQQIDYVNFQFYAYDKSTTVSQFLGYYDTQQSNYAGGKVLASMLSDRSGGLTPENGFFDACRSLKQQGKLPGIFIWAADSSKSRGFDDEKQAQEILAS